jgi:hypothetical protein
LLCHLVLRKINKNVFRFFTKLLHVPVKRVFWLHTTSDENVSTQNFLSDFSYVRSFR